MHYVQGFYPTRRSTEVGSKCFLVMKQNSLPKWSHTNFFIVKEYVKTIISNVNAWKMNIHLCAYVKRIFTHLPSFPFKNTSMLVKYCFTFCCPPLRFSTYWFLFWFSMLSFLKSQITSEFTFIDISVQEEATVAWRITVDYSFSGHYNFNLEQASPVVIIANLMWFIRLHLHYWAKQGPGTCLSSTMW